MYGTPHLSRSPGPRKRIQNWYHCYRSWYHSGEHGVPSPRTPMFGAGVPRDPTDTTTASNGALSGAVAVHAPAARLPTCLHPITVAPAVLRYQEWYHPLPEVVSRTELSAERCYHFLLLIPSPLVPSHSPPEDEVRSSESRPTGGAVLGP